MKSIALALLLAGALTVFSWEHAVALDVWLSDRSFSNLAELDLALEVGEISLTEYELLLEIFLSGGLPDSTCYAEPGRTVPSAGFPERESRRRIGLRYRGALIQQLESNYEFRRYDRLGYESEAWRCDMWFEQRDGGDALIRSRSLSFRHPAGRITLGSYTLKLGQGVTIGNSPFAARLRRYGSLAESFLLPLRNRENGLLLESNYRQFGVTAFGSQLEGEEFYRRSTGGAVAIEQTGLKLQLIFLQQEIGSHGLRFQRSRFVASAFEINTSGLRLEGELALQLKHGGAQVLSAAGDVGGLRERILLFNYTPGFKNPQSGGYAYPDYEQTEMEEVAFGFSDKRSGRMGGAVSSRYSNRGVVNLQADLIRWKNRIDRRQCIAARIRLAISRRIGPLSSLTVRGIWENLDMRCQAGDERKHISLSTRWIPAAEHLFKLYIGSGERILAGALKHPLKIQCDWHGDLAEEFSLDAGINYYDADRHSARNDYIAIYLQQSIKHEDWVEFTVRGRTRYRPNTAKWGDWELRISAATLY